uniref:Alpha-1-B glycoprotein n=1 Tax=Myotis myotis TaxID=51298 RepID=A0A7J7QU54_MYOMY|nr:alpha-1-B glycoprotein [Myotis myotis]
MATLAAFLLLWGLSLSPAAEAATFIDTRPDLWAEAGSLQEPWANLTLVCRALLGTSDFQLFKDGELQERVRFSEGGLEHRFPLGAVTADTQGLYRCRYAMGENRWTSLSNLVEVTGADTLPAPELSSKPVSWISPGLTPTLLCRAGLAGVTFLLRRQGDDQFLEVAEAPEAVQATFQVHRAGNYSCSYRTLWSGKVSPGRDAALRCETPVAHQSLELLAAGEVVASAYGPSEDLVLTYVGPQHAGKYSCRYRSWWPLVSELSDPVELQVAER